MMTQMMMRVAVRQVEINCSFFEFAAMWCFLHFHTNKLPPNAHIMEVACVSVCPDTFRVIGVWSTKVKLPTGVEIDPVATDIHKLTAYDLINAPSMDQVKPILYSYLHGNPIFAHCAMEFHMVIINELFGSVGAPVPSEVNDTLRVARLVLPNESDYRLIGLRRKFQTKARDHSKALQVALTVRDVFAHLRVLWNEMP